MASSSCNPYVTVEVGQEYPYPSNVCAPNFVTIKLSGREKYVMWKTQMLCLLKSHGMFAFIDGTLLCPRSVSGKEQVGGDNWLWTRSDNLVKGWILGSMSEQTLGYVLKRLTEKVHQQKNADFSAKDVWDELQIMYGRAVLPQVRTTYGPAVLPQPVLADQHEEEARRAKSHKNLYEATVDGNWANVEHILTLKTPIVTVIEKITNNGNTALHVAVSNVKDPEFLEKMLEHTPENTQLLDLRNSDGSTLLHVAAIVGNTDAAKILVARNRDLLFATDNEGHTPLTIALSNMHRETSHHLLEHLNTGIEADTLFSGPSGDELLATVISSKDFRLAINLLRRYKTLHSDAVLMAISQNFPRQPSIMEGSITLGRTTYDVLKIAADYIISTCEPLCGSWGEVILRPFYRGIPFIITLFLMIPCILVWPFISEKYQSHCDALELLQKVYTLINNSIEPSSHHHYYTIPILEATRQNAYDVVDHMLFFFPNAIWTTNEDGHNIIQYAIINRSETIYNILYLMSEHKNLYRTLKDSSGNNLLHLAARLAPANKLKQKSGAALQIQRELQWYKEVEGFVCPLNIKQKNSHGETPEMVFTREHKDLVTEGEKWMKATAESYTITAALITTIVFAAAITVPGGNNDKGIPIFTNNTAFKIFAISDAISLFTAITSLLMFLSILTARFAEQDFLLKLPTKLIIGLATLFISTTAMVLAFAATLYVVFGQSHSGVLIPIIVVLTCLPITSFVTLQFPLVIDLMSATYGQSIFGKKREVLDIKLISQKIMRWVV